MGEITFREPGNAIGLLAEALEMSAEMAPLEKRLRQAFKEGLIASEYLGLQIDEAASAEVISADEATRLRDYHGKVSALLDVDDFDPSELGRRQEVDAPAPVSKAAKRKTPPRTKTAGKKKASKKKTGKVAKKTAKKADKTDNKKS